MKIALLLPNHSGHIVGSLLVYYRYAQGLAEAGHQVDIYHPALLDAQPTAIAKMRSILWCALKNMSRRPVSWFAPPPGVRLHFRPRIDSLRLPHERVVAFSWRAIEAMSTISGPGSRFGYVVEYETWAEADENLRARMERSYRQPLPMLCSSIAVEEMLHGVGARDVRLCTQGVDIERFASRAVSPRPPGRIGFPIRTETVKSPEVLEEALRILRSRRGAGIHLWGYGGDSIPEGVEALLDERYVRPSDDLLASLCGTTSIFLLPSRLEGFGMPAAEAMAAGCAVVSADNGGIRTFGRHNENCLIVPPNDPVAIADAACELLDDPRRLGMLGKSASESVGFLSWSLANVRFHEALALR